MQTTQAINNNKKLIFCSYSCIYSSLVLNKLLEDKNIDVVAIVNSSRILKPDYGVLTGSLKQIRLSGWRYSTYLFLITDIFHWLQAVLTLRKQSLKTIHGIAKQNDIPIINTKDINGKESIDFIRNHQADFLLAAHFNQLVKPEILAMPSLECLNIHPSLLPAFKGVDPVFYAILQKQGGVGVSLHRMAESFDTGEVLLQAEQAIAITGNCLFSINCELFVKGAELAVNWINGVQPPTIPTLLENDDQYDSWPTVEKVAQFSGSGSKLMCLLKYLSIIFTGKQA